MYLAQTAEIAEAGAEVLQSMLSANTLNAIIVLALIGLVVFGITVYKMLANQGASIESQRSTTESIGRLTEATYQNSLELKTMTAELITSRQQAKENENKTQEAIEASQKKIISSMEDFADKAIKIAADSHREDLKLVTSEIITNQQGGVNLAEGVTDMLTSAMSEQIDKMAEKLEKAFAESTERLKQELRQELDARFKHAIEELKSILKEAQQEEGEDDESRNPSDSI